MTDEKQLINFSDFLKCEIHVGVVISAEANERARKPAYVLTIDFGAEIGIKTSSAQITEAHNMEDLIDTQVIAVTNFPSKRVAGVKSEVLVLAAVEPNGMTVLLSPSQQVELGSRVF